MMKVKPSKKAEMTSQVFTYILAAVIVGVIVFVGYQAIASYSESIQRSNADEIKRNLKRNVIQSRPYQTVKRFEIKLPSGIDEVCFASSLESGAFSDVVKTNTDLAAYPLIKNSIENDAGQNVFFLDQAKIEDTLYLENVTVSSGFFCVDSGDIWLNGLGAATCIKPQQEGTC